MSSRELAQEIARLRPPRVIDLVERDRAVLQAEAERQALQNQHTEAGSAAARARDQAQAWREAHKVQAWFHDKGIGHAPKLRELEQQREEHRAEWQRLGQRIEEASLRVQHVRQQAHQRITAEQEPTLAKLAELEALQKEKARQEREAEAKRLAQKRLEAEREAVPKDFKLMAQKREMKASGWSDRGEQWKAAPEGLLDESGANLDPFKVWDCMMKKEKPGGHGERSVAVGTIDMAIWDAVAKIAGKPLFRLLAERHNCTADPRVFVYAAGGYYYPGKDNSALRAEMRGYLDRGYSVVKMKIGGASIPEDRERIEAVLKEIDKDAQLAVDANGLAKTVNVAILDNSGMAKNVTLDAAALAFDPSKNVLVAAMTNDQIKALPSEPQG